MKNVELEEAECGDGVGKNSAKLDKVGRLWSWNRLSVELKKEGKVWSWRRKKKVWS